jgi:hypothetical protein
LKKTNHGVHGQKCVCLHLNCWELISDQCLARLSIPKTNW